MYTNRERFIKSLEFVHSEIFVFNKGFFVGNKGTIYSENKRLVKSDMFRVNGVQTRRKSFIFDSWNKNDVSEKEKIEEVIDLTPLQKKKNKNKGFRKYRREVDIKTNMQPIHLLKDISKRGFRDYNIDHILPVRYCYDHGISIDECANIKNLQVLSSQENFIKGNDIYCVISQCDHLKKLI